MCASSLPLFIMILQDTMLTTGNQRRQPPGARELGPEPSRGIEREPVHHQQPVVVRHSGPGSRRVRVQIHQGEQHGVGDLGGGPEPYVYGRVRSADGVGYLAVTRTNWCAFCVTEGRVSIQSTNFEKAVQILGNKYKFWEIMSFLACHFVMSNACLLCSFFCYHATQNSGTRCY